MKLLSLAQIVVLVGCSSEARTPVAGNQPARTPRPAVVATRPALPATDAVVIPGESIGPFRIGMSRAEIHRLGLPTCEPASSVVVTGPYELFLNKDDTLIAVSRRLAFDHDGTSITDPVLLGSTAIASLTTFDELRAIVPGCTAPVAGDGGTVADCADGTKVIDGPGGVMIVVATR